jgi:uncharacterized OsmC-like protein
MSALEPYLHRKAAAIAARTADFTAAPERARVALSASAQVAGISGARVVKMGEHRLVSDSAPGLAGFALGPTAPELLLGALASCLVHTYLIHAVLLSVPLDDVTVTVEGALDYAGVIGMPTDVPIAMQDVRYHAEVRSPAAREQIEALHAAVDANCPVLNTLRLPIAVTRDEG